MFLSIGQIRAIVDQFLELSSIHPEHIQITLSGHDEKGEMSTIHAGYSLEGFYPEKETSTDVIPEEVTRRCAWCDKPLTVDDDIFCKNCGADYNEDYYDRGDNDAD